MAGTVEKKLASLGITLPTPASPIANYVPFVRSGNLLIAFRPALLRRRRQAGGQGPARRRRLDRGRAEGGARLRRSICWRRSRPRSAISTRSAACVRLGGFINSAPGFTDGPKVMNGASDLMVEVFGDKGRHARITVGVAALPADAAVEVEGLFEVA